MLRNLFALCCAVVAVAVLSQFGFAADATRLLTGRDIKDGTVTSADIKDRTEPATRR